MLDLVKYYNSHVPSDENISEKDIIQEWNIVKSYLLTNCSKSSNQDIYEELYGMDVVSNIIKLIRFYLCHPVSNACVERGFSLMNLIKTDVRSRMLDDLLDASMSIKYNGVEPKDIAIDSELIRDAEDHWRNQRRRRFL